MIWKNKLKQSQFFYLNKFYQEQLSSKVFKIISHLHQWCCNLLNLMEPIYFDQMVINNSNNDSVSNKYKLRAKFFFQHSWIRHLPWVIFFLWASKNCWSSYGDWPQGETMAGWRPPMMGQPRVTIWTLTSFGSPEKNY